MMSGRDTERTCSFLDWDSEFFGHRIGRVNSHRLTSATLEQALLWARDNDIECLYLLCDHEDDETISLAREAGFRLVDLRVELKRDLNDLEPAVGPARIRTWQDGDLVPLKEIAAKSHVATRFFADPRFQRSKCQELYETWLVKACHGRADEVLVAELDSRACGYLACKLLEGRSVGSIDIVGVGESARGTGIGKQLVQAALWWFSDQGAQEVRVTTQGHNVAALGLYRKCGFYIDLVRVWFHGWFDA